MDLTGPLGEGPGAAEEGPHFGAEGAAFARLLAVLPRIFVAERSATARPADPSPRISKSRIQFPSKGRRNKENLSPSRGFWCAASGGFSPLRFHVVCCHGFSFQYARAILE